MSEHRSAHTVLLGAEGLTEIEGQSWWRHANRAETSAFLTWLNLPPDANPFMDGLGRPYWLIVLEPTAPAQAIDTARRYRRVVRLLE